jgi:hypothetical protein
MEEKKKKEEEEEGLELTLTRRYKVHLYLLKQHRKLPPYNPTPDPEPVPLGLVNTTLFIALTAALVTDSSLALVITIPITYILLHFSLDVTSL